MAWLVSDFKVEKFNPFVQSTNPYPKWIQVFLNEEFTLENKVVYVAPYFLF